MTTPPFLDNVPFCLTHPFLANIFRPSPISINFEKVDTTCIKCVGGGGGGGGGAKSSNYAHIIHICVMYAMYFKFKQVKRYLTNLSNMLKENHVLYEYFA